MSCHAGEEGAAAVLTAAELEARRWDGYRGMVAPQLRGEGSWPKASLQAAFELRMQAAVDAMLMRVPFWFAVRPISLSSSHLLATPSLQPHRLVPGACSKPDRCQCALCCFTLSNPLSLACNT